MKIAMDLDGVLASTIPAIIEMAHKLYAGVKIDLTRYDLGLDEETLNKVLSTMIRCKIFGKLPLMDGAMDVLMLNDDDTIWYLTARSTFPNGSIKLSNSVREQTIRWLNKHKFPQCENLIFTEDKIKTCVELGVKYLVEDCWEATKGAYRQGVTVYLIDRSYNQEHDLRPFGEYSYPNRVRTIREAINRARQREEVET